MSQRIIPALLLTLGLVALTGCASPTVITLNDARQIHTTPPPLPPLNHPPQIQPLAEPNFDEDSGFYEFEQLDGKRAKVNKDQVRTVKEL